MKLKDNPLKSACVERDSFHLEDEFPFRKSYLKRGKSESGFNFLLEGKTIVMCSFGQLRI